MALNKKVYGVKTPISPRIFTVHGVFDHHPKSRKPVVPQSEIGNLVRLQLKLQFVCDKGDKFRIRGFSLGIADGIPKEALEGIQIASVPCYLNGMADGSFHPARCGLECFRHLGVEHLGDGIRVPDGPRRGFWTRSFVRCFIAFSVAHFTIGSLGLS